MIQLLTGENNYEIRVQRTQIITEYKNRYGSNAIDIVDGSMITTHELPQLLTGASLFAAQHLIVLDDAAAQKTVWDKLTDYLPERDAGNDVLLVSPLADKRTKTYKWLQTYATISTLSYLNETHLVNWVQNKAREYNLDIPADVARYIIEFTAGDQWQLTNDLRKLSLSGQPVTVELIRDVLIPNPQGSAFDLLDAALHGKTRRVNLLLDSVRSHEDPYRFFGLLSSQMVALHVCAVSGNRSAETIAKNNGLHPFVVRKTLPLARQVSFTKQKRLAEVMATTDVQLKTSGAEPWVLITALLKTIAALT